MILRPRLVKAIMDMPTIWKTSPDVITHFQVEVELWKSVGLCVHKRNKWAVSHFQSGRFLSQRFDTREDAIQFMTDVRKNVLSDWRMSWEQFIARRDFDVIQEKIKSIRKDDSDVKNIQTGKGKTDYKPSGRV
jgi:hypothetical protein